MPELLEVADILANDRIREDLGDLDVLCSSILEFGLIQPIVLVRSDVGSVSLVAGGRRLSAIKRLGWRELEHAKHYIWRDEVLNGDESVKLKLTAIELEENLKRKDMTWDEIATGQKRLLETMQRIHGSVKSGRPSAADKQLGSGFGVNKLAAMLGQSPATISQNIQLADAIEKIPSLAKAPTAESARRQINVINVIGQMSAVDRALKTVQSLNTSPSGASSAATAVATPKAKAWTLYETDFRLQSQNIASETVDLVYTDLPYGVGLDKMSKHNSGSVSYTDRRQDVVASLSDFASEAFRVLRPDRYGVVFFGFNYYSQLCEALETAGFGVNRVPGIWYKRTNSSENPNTRYGNAYDAYLVFGKGKPAFIRPGRQNVKEISPVTGGKLQVAQQPVALVQDFLQDMTVAGATVVDFCAGTGTTAVASLQLGRKVILFEKDPEQVLIIKGRLAAF